MKVLSKLHAKEGIWLTDVDVPEVGHNEVKIKIKKTAICGTDLHIYKWDDWAQKTIPVPMHIGHEFVGEIVELGDAVENLSVGMRVSGEGHLVCGRCRNCQAGKRHLCPKTVGVGVNRPGAFAEYLVIPAENAFVLPDAIDDNIASILDPLGNAVHTALSFDLVGEDVLITGAGPIGIMAVAVAKRAGARHIVITDVNDYRLDLARKMGADAAVNITKEDIRDVMKQHGINSGFDIGLEMSGNPDAFKQMFELLYHGGRMALLGIPPENTQIDWNHVIFKGLFIKGIYGREMYETWYKMSSLITSGLDLSPVITHEFPVDDYEKAFETALSGQSGKVILDWTK
jgi:threonine 3-dehydrogenase